MHVYPSFYAIGYSGVRRDQFHFGEGSMRFPKAVGLVKTSRP